ncbi:cyclin-dependent kinase inhibitor [Musa troglodytarum]|nr:cyclin-dependent kinase inhibitor [Musa troglodytarum]
MGRYTTKCSRAVDELAVMEVTQVVGARTRARTLALSSGAAAAGPKRRNAAAPPPEVVQTSSYLQLRSRRLVMLTRGKTQRPVNSSASSNPDPSVEGVSRCSSNASSEVVFNKQASRKRKLWCNSNSFSRIGSVLEGEVLDSSTCNFESRRARLVASNSSKFPTLASVYADCLDFRREMPPSNEAQCEAGDLESMMEARSSWRRAEATPTQAEIEEFFAAAEREQAQQFAGK